MIVKKKHFAGGGKKPIQKHHNHRRNLLLCEGSTPYWFFHIIASLALSVSVLIMKAVSELTLPAEEQIMFFHAFSYQPLDFNINV